MANSARRSRVRGSIKKVEAAIKSGDKKAAMEALKAAQPEIQRGATARIIAKNAAARAAVAQRHGDDQRPVAGLDQAGPARDGASVKFLGRQPPLNATGRQLPNGEADGEPRGGKMLHDGRPGQ